MAHVGTQLRRLFSQANLWLLGKETNIMITDPDLAKPKNLLERAGIKRQPVSPLAIAKNLGFKVLAVNFFDENLAGTVTVKDKDVTIAISAKDAPTRRVFTIAHEIGHAMLHLRDAEQGKFSDTGSAFSRHSAEVGISTEIEANNFAAELLMPDDWIREAFATEKNAKSLAVDFGVSEEAMKYRLKNLGLT